MFRSLWETQKKCLAPSFLPAPAVPAVPAIGTSTWKISLCLCYSALQIKKILKKVAEITIIQSILLSSLLPSLLNFIRLIHVNFINHESTILNSKIYHKEEKKRLSQEDKLHI